MFGIEALELARMQFAFTVSFHILFPAITIGLASYLAVLEGLWLRTGRLWWKETRVPASRVQHVDLKHGPLERRFRLATLVVHTAAVHLSGITVRGLDEADAHYLRDQLARQLDDAGDAL